MSESGWVMGFDWGWLTVNLEQCLWSWMLISDFYQWPVGQQAFFFFDWRKCPVSHPSWDPWDWKKSIWVSKLVLNFDIQNLSGSYMGNTSRRTQRLLEETEYFNGREPDTGENGCAESMCSIQEGFEFIKVIVEFMWKDLDFVFWVWRNRSNI